MSMRPLRLRPAILWLVFVMLVVGVSRAEDPAPKPESDIVIPAHLRIDRTLRYSCDFGPLRRLRLQAADQTALTAFFDPEDARGDTWGSRLYIERMADSTPDRRVAGEIRRFARGGEIVESSDDARLGGKPALHRLAKTTKGGRVLARVEKGDPAKGYWSLTAICVGEKAEEELAVMRKVVDSLTTDLSKPRPEGVYEDRLFGYRISLAGLTGPRWPLSTVPLEMCSLRLSDDWLGNFGVWVGGSSGSPDADWAEIRRRQEKTGARLVKTEVLKLGERPARDAVWETGEGEKKGTLRLRLIWDDGVRWAVQITHPGAAAEERAKPLHAVLESFRVHDEKPEDDGKGD